mgnify:CR=1 FL=1|jgi:hypothetical protein|tara:strand:- start:2602 stop:3282 length:681 start_codon:yes stop_codon:yes gene_type:complete
MATSGTVTFRPNVEEIIDEAFERCGVDAQTRTGYHAVSARRSLNFLFSEWANRGWNYWTLGYKTVTLVADQATYTLDAGLVDIVDVVYRKVSGSTSTDQSMTRIAISDYNQIPDKTTSGVSSQYMIDRQYTPTMTVWSVPDNTSDSIRYYGIFQPDDITASNEDADIPYRWSDALCAGLSAKLAEKFNPERTNSLYQLYERAFQFASDEEGANVSLQIKPRGISFG